MSLSLIFRLQAAYAAVIGLHLIFVQRVVDAQYQLGFSA